MIGILGSGFGLYGYLPAAISIFKSPILLPKRYKRVVESRADLLSYARNIQWLEVEDDIFKSVSGLIIARRPEDQFELVSSALVDANILFLVLEKPLAKSPEIAIKLIKRLIDSPKFFRIGYTFRHAPWANLVADSVRYANANDEISIEWKFLANHYRTKEKNWKKYVSAGGGAIRFYGIQLIGFLAELGYSEVHFSNVVEPSQDEASKWEAVFGGANMPRCKISINTISNINIFNINMKIHGEIKALVCAEDPFEIEGEVASFDLIYDRRISELKDICREIHGNSLRYYPWYLNSLYLWSEVEKNSLILKNYSETQ